MKTKMKKITLILVSLGLFSLSLYLAYRHGNPVADTAVQLRGAFEPMEASPLFYTGLKGEIAKWFSVIFNSLMEITGKSVMLAIMALALLVELVLLYPSVNIQLKQKKIHLFHKKLIDKFNRGELSVNKTEDELHKLYDVNQRIHFRGAIMVITQLLLFLFTFWGLNLMVHNPNLLYGSWNIMNFSLLSKIDGALIPLVAALIYFVHSMTKVYYKEIEDYISPAQTTIAFLFAIIGSVTVFFFAGLFPLALTMYFVTLITISTFRYILVEQEVKKWGNYAQRSLIKMLKEAKPFKSRFAYFSAKWNHLPLVRHINFNLLEEALSMTLGLLLALTFFGAFNNDADFKITENTRVDAECSEECELPSNSLIDTVL